MSDETSVFGYFAGLCEYVDVTKTSYERMASHVGDLLSRGAAYQPTGDYLASDPLCWRNIGKTEQIEVLPVSAERYLPHSPPW